MAATGRSVWRRLFSIFINNYEVCRQVAIDIYSTKYIHVHIAYSRSSRLTCAWHTTNVRGAYIYTTIAARMHACRVWACNLGEVRYVTACRYMNVYLTGTHAGRCIAKATCMCGNILELCYNWLYSYRVGSITLDTQIAPTNMGKLKEKLGRVRQTKIAKRFKFSFAVLLIKERLTCLGSEKSPRFSAG